MKRTVPTLTQKSAITAVKDQMDIMQVVCLVSSCGILCNGGAPSCCGTANALKCTFLRSGEDAPKASLLLESSLMFPRTLRIVGHIPSPY